MAIQYKILRHVPGEVEYSNDTVLCDHDEHPDVLTDSLMEYYLRNRKPPNDVKKAIKLVQFYLNSDEGFAQLRG